MKLFIGNDPERLAMREAMPEPAHCEGERFYCPKWIAPVCHYAHERDLLSRSFAVEEFEKVSVKAHNGTRLLVWKSVSDGKIYF